MKLKGRRQKPEVKLKRRPRKEKETWLKKYTYGVWENPKCLECGEETAKLYTVESRVELCPECFDAHFEILDGDDKFSFVVREKEEGTAERMHKLWLCRFKEGGGMFANWDQTLMEFGREDE